MQTNPDNLFMYIEAADVLVHLVGPFNCCDRFTAAMGLGLSWVQVDSLCPYVLSLMNLIRERESESALSIVFGSLYNILSRLKNQWIICSEFHTIYITCGHNLLCIQSTLIFILLWKWNLISNTWYLLKKDDELGAAIAYPIGFQCERSENF